MDSGHELRRLSQQLPALPADIADRITRALADESVSRAEAQACHPGTPVAVPAQRSGGGELLASYVPRPRRADDSG
jgi:hypothetical protein